MAIVCRSMPRCRSCHGGDHYFPLADALARVAWGDQAEISLTNVMLRNFRILATDLQPARLLFELISN